MTTLHILYLAGFLKTLTAKKTSSILQAVFLGQRLYSSPIQRGQTANCCCSNRNIYIYYINTNEIPGEHSRENLVFSHAKITCYLHMWKYYLWYGYIINRAFHTKKLLEWNGLVFFRVEKIFRSFTALTREIFFNTRWEISYLRAAM